MSGETVVKLVEGRIRGMIEASIEVFGSCCLSNGAIVAANTDFFAYPKDAKPYRYVWPRDAAYVCVAADLLGVKDVQEPFFEWCLNRAQGVREEGLFKENYHTNGIPNIQTGFHQLDQTGSVLWAIHHHFGGKMPEDENSADLIKKLADGLCKIWSGDHFSIPCTDLWEERVAYPDLKQIHVYSLAACAHGLKCAYEMVDDNRWDKALDEMNRVIKNDTKTLFTRTLGEIPDKAIDASLLGLIWPFSQALPLNDERIQNTIKKIEDKNVENGGIIRYEGDVYDGWVTGTQTRRCGAGVWPLLNLWMSIAQVDMGNKKRATEFFEWMIGKIDDYIPEQIFSNDLQQSPMPLAWSHSMFIIAVKKLDLL